MNNEDWRAKREWCFRVGNLEVGSCDDRLSYSIPQNRAEISCWDGENKSRWVIATYERTGDGINLHWVGDRPLHKQVKWIQFKKIAKIGFRLMRAKST